MGTQQQTNLPRTKENIALASQTPSLPTKQGTSSNAYTYVTAGIICFILASIVFIIAKPVEKTGPPQDGMAQGGESGQVGQNGQSGLPSGHPDTATGQVVLQLRERIAMLNSSLKEHPENVTIHLDLANALYDLGDMSGDSTKFAEAVVHYRTFLAATPDDPDARTDLAYGLYRTGNVDGAIAELYKVQAKHPRHQHSAFNLALMYKEKNQPDSVLAYIKRAADIDSTSQVGRNAAEILKEYGKAHTPSN